MERVFGMDVHKNVLVTTVITEEGEETRWSGVGAADLKNLMEWLKEKKCHKGVMESSGIYWVPIYVTLVDNEFQVTVANAHQVKAIPGAHDWQEIRFFFDVFGVFGVFLKDFERVKCFGLVFFVFCF